MEGAPESNFELRRTLGNQSAGYHLAVRQRLRREPADYRHTVAGGFPILLPAPSVKPSTFFTPPQQLRTNAQPITVFAPKMQLPTVHEWNVSIQRELPWGLVVQAAYIGRRGTHLFMAYDINQ